MAPDSATPQGHGGAGRGASLPTVSGRHREAITSRQVGTMSYQTLEDLRDRYATDLDVEHEENGNEVSISYTCPELK